MKKLFKKRMVDERMELQSLRNAKKCWAYLLLGIGFSSLLKIYVFHWDLKYSAPELIVLFAASVYNLYLDYRDGNVYTSENSDRKKVSLLYIATSAATGLFSGYGAYSLSHSVPVTVMTFIITAGIACGGMFLLDSFLYRWGKRRLDKKEKTEQETDC